MNRFLICFSIYAGYITKPLDDKRAGEDATDQYRAFSKTAATERLSVVSLSSGTVLNAISLDEQYFESQRKGLQHVEPALGARGCEAGEGGARTGALEFEGLVVLATAAASRATSAVW